MFGTGNSGLKGILMLVGVAILCIPVAFVRGMKKLFLNAMGKFDKK